LYKIIYYCFYFLYSIQKNEYFDFQILIIDYFCRYENGSKNLDFLSRAYMQTHTEPPFSYGSWIYNYLCNQWCDVSSNLDQGEVYKIMWWSLSMTCDRSVVFSGSSGFIHQSNWPPPYNCNIVESGVKHHQTNKQTTSKHTHAHPYVMN
jgi:hypothetical protein